MTSRLLLAYTLMGLTLAFIAVMLAVTIRKRRAANFAKWGHHKPE